jgi:predicted O-methyltransferase YrrM
VPMNGSEGLKEPKVVVAICADTRASGFAMAADPLTCSLQRTLAAAKFGGRFLELGTGTGLSTAWLLDGMDKASRLMTVNNDEAVLAIASHHLGHDLRLTVVCADGDAFLRSIQSEQFDFVFADTWSGKYRLLGEALTPVRPGGMYVIDDMLPQPNWPEGHAAKVETLIGRLQALDGFKVAKLDWASGVIIATRTLDIRDSKFLTASDLALGA